jgi:hypothetical protein
VVTAVAAPVELALDVEEPELDEEDDGVPVATAELDEPTCLVVVVAVAASAGSCPELSCTRRPPVEATNRAVPAPTMRRRMRRIRAWRAWRAADGMTRGSTLFFAGP